MTRRLLAPAVVLAMLLSACGGENTGSGDPASDGGGTSSAADADRDAVFRWTTSTGAPTLDPHRVGSTYYNQYLFPIYDRLTRQLPDGTIEPMLATEWEVIEGDEPALEMTLRDDVTFPSGTPFDADVVQQNIERAQTMTESVLKSDLAAVESVEVLSPTEVRFNLKSPLPGLATVLSDRAGMMIDPAMFDSPDLSLLGAGVGPFVLEEHQPNSRLVYVRNEADYWEPEAQQLAGITMTIVPDDETRLNALVTDQVDGMELRASQVDRAEQSGLQVIEAPTARNHVLTMNTGKGPLADQQVRQAINHAIDRQAISESILYGKCEPAVQGAPEGYITHNEELDADYYEYDPELAREMLADAGYADGFAIELIANNQPLYVSLAEAIQAQLAEVGIEMSIRQVPSTDIVDIFYIQGIGDVSNAQGVPQADPSQTARAAWTADGSLNPGGATTPEIEELVAEVSQESDEAALEEAWNELTQLVVDFAFRADICNQIVSFGANDRVQNLEVFLLTNYDFRDVYMTAG